MPDGDDDRKRRFINRLRPAARNIEPSSEKAADDGVRAVGGPLASRATDISESQKHEGRGDPRADPAVLKALQREARRQARRNRNVPLPTQHVEILPQLPQPQRARPYGLLLSFFAIVALPIIAASIYYFGIASNQYVSEFRFAVTDTSNTSSGAAAGVPALAVMLGASPSQNPLQNYMVADFLGSRQAVDELQKRLDIRSMYSGPRLDPLSGFDAQQPMEKFVAYWQNMMTASFDQVTGLVTAKVRAFTAEDAFTIANTLVSMAEDLVNDIVRRPNTEAVRLAEREVKRAEDRLKAVRSELTKYRSAEAVIDPTPGAVTSNLTLALSLRTSLMQLQNELEVMRKQGLGANAHAVVTIEKRINTTKEQLAGVEAQVSKNRDGLERPLSEVVGAYEQLDLERQFAQTMLTSTMQTLEQARANAISQHIYVTPYVRPALPQSSVYPQRFLSVAAVAAISLLIWISIVMVIRSIQDHRG